MGFSKFSKTCFIHDVPRANLEFIGKNIRDIRRRSGLTLAELAAKIGIQEGPLGRIERGLNSPSARVIYRLSKVFNVSIDTLFAEDEVDFLRFKRLDATAPYPVELLGDINLSKKSQARVNAVAQGLEALDEIAGGAPKAEIPLRPPFDITVDGLTRLAGLVRGYLGLGENGSQDIVGALESAGFRVVFIPFKEDIEGMTYYSPATQSAIFFLNANKSYEKCLFQLAMEFGGLFLWLKTIDRDRSSDMAIAGELSPLEAAERFAIEFLTPATNVREITRRAKMDKFNWSFDLLTWHKQRFGVTAIRYLNRLIELDLIDLKLASSFKDNILAMNEKSKNREPLSVGLPRLMNRAVWETALTAVCVDPKSAERVKKIEDNLNRVGLQR